MSKTTIFNIIRSITRFGPVERLLTNYTQGKSKASFFSKIPLNYTEYKSPTFRTVQRNGINFKLDISDYIEWIVYFGLELEPRKPIFDITLKGDIVFDIGSNIGEVALRLAKHVGENGFVHAFEPDPTIFSKLTTNVSMNSFDNIKLHQIGLGDQRATMQMAPEVSNNLGGNRIVSSGVKGNDVQIQTLDQFVEDNNIDKIDMIKLDVEGYELKVLVGAKLTLEKYRPKLFVEVSDRNLKQQKSTAKELISLIAKKYTTLINAENGSPINLNQDYTDCFFDLIAYNED